jgi:hypothetical protein
MPKKGFAIALAWPETKCKQAGAWYDKLLYRLGINNNGYYKVGHAAIVLVDSESGKCSYFDFGRYHSPYGYGRVRSLDSDDDLYIEIKAQFSEGKNEIVNLDNILSELYSNSSTHGDGRIVGISTSVNYTKAICFINELIEKEFINYGPFHIGGTNCSRFVSSVIKRSTSSLAIKFKLQFPLSISPSPMWNLWAIGTEHSTVGKDKSYSINTRKLVLNSLS